MEAIDLKYPFTSRWLVQNSPANRVPSHGTTLFASSYAIDFVPLDDAGRPAPLSVGSLFSPEPPERFPGFGRPILAPAHGTVVAIRNDDADHAAYRGLPSIGYALTQRGRAAAGWESLGGNYVFIERSGGGVVVLCHLQHESLLVQRGQPVRAGQVIARCGNSGNSTEPHLHVQVIDSADIKHAQAVPLRFGGTLPRTNEIVTVEP
ncbi:M23 family metallopeptidase [Zhihengliuella halotolerans]|uniref:M23 family metallopeptidase n=1 Tax=Zhihengliuella halotolerans TaxID=370736 RepID=UPI000C808F9F|nr:M23 family metallopeptidase [Zhihengliuella halotolerans]